MYGSRRSSGGDGVVELELWAKVRNSQVGHDCLDGGKVVRLGIGFISVNRYISVFKKPHPIYSGIP